jgi:hypothetical protein
MRKSELWVSMSVTRRQEKFRPFSSAVFLEGFEEAVLAASRSSLKPSSSTCETEKRRSPSL